MNKFIYPVLIFLLVSCSSGKTAGPDDSRPRDSVQEEKGALARAGSDLMAYSLEIFPAEVSRNSTLRLKVTGFDPAGAEIEWLLNGNPVDSPAPHIFKADIAKRGDIIQARAVISENEVLSNRVTIGNALPEIQQVKFLPEIITPGFRLSVEATVRDLDEDDVDVLYEWTKNGKPAGTGKEMGEQVKRGDKIKVGLTPFDGESYGRRVVLEREVTNMRPVITENKKFDFDGNVFVYQLNTADPDGDTLSYTLQSSPKGMTIDPKTGLVRWNVPAEFKGKAAFTVAVSDGNGGESKQDLSFEIRDEAPL